MSQLPPKEDELRWLLVDFDQTIADNSGYPKFTPLWPLVGAKKALTKLADDGWKITIYTARPWSDYSVIEEWLDRYDIPHRRIICGKPLGRYIIDDRNIAFDGDWSDVLKKIPKLGE